MLDTRRGDCFAARQELLDDLEGRQLSLECLSVKYLILGFRAIIIVDLTSIQSRFNSHSIGSSTESHPVVSVRVI